MTDEQWSEWAQASSSDADSDMTVPRRKGSASGPVFRLRLDDGSEHEVRGRAFAGRSPEPQPPGLGGALIAIPDPTMSVSKTHCLFDIVDGGLRVSDLGSTNGTVLSSSNGDVPVPVGTWRHVAVGDRVSLGDRWLDVVAGGAAGEAPGAPGAAAAGGLISAVPPASAPAVAPAEPAPPTGPAVLGHVPPPDVMVAPGPGEVQGQPTVGRQCVTCGSALAPDTLFCMECGTPAPVEAPTATRRWKPMLIAAGAVALLALVVVAAMVIRGGGSGGTSNSAAAGPRMSSDPTSRYSTDLDAGWETGDYFRIAGSSDALFVAWDDYDREELVVQRIDDDGEPRWDTTIDGAFDYYGSFQVVGGVAFVGSYDSARDEQEIHALDGDSGDELWSETLDLDQDWWAASDGVYVIDDQSIDLLDSRSGDQLGRARLAGSRSPISDLYRLGVVISWDREDEEVQVFGSDLEELTDRIDVRSANDVSYGNGTLVAVDGDSLIGFDRDGGEKFDVRTSVDDISYLLPVGGDRWVVSDGSETEVVDTGDGERLWNANGSLNGVFVAGGRTVVYVRDDGDDVMLDAASGDVLTEERGDGYVTEVGPDGYVYDETSRATAVRLPSGEELWSQRVRDDETLRVLDGGYVLISRDQDETTIEVFG